MTTYFLAFLRHSFLIARITFVAFAASFITFSFVQASAVGWPWGLHTRVA